jgi:hypothetical protein
VEAEQDEPDHRGGPVQAARELERVPVQEPHRDSAAEQDHGGGDEERREQAHRELRRAVRDVVAAAGVVAREPPACARQLEEDRRDQGEADEHVQRHERVHAEQDRRDLDEDGHEHEHSDRRRQALVPVRVHPTIRPPHRATVLPGR